MRLLQEAGAPSWIGRHRFPSQAAPLTGTPWQLGGLSASHEAFAFGSTRGSKSKPSHPSIEVGTIDHLGLAAADCYLIRYNFADVLALEDDRVAASSAPFSAPFPGCVMVNQLPTDEPSSACALCGQPFNVHNNHVYAWRSTGGKLYCSEFCADDEDEEARVPYRRRA